MRPTEQARWRDWILPLVILFWGIPFWLAAYHRVKSSVYLLSGWKLVGYSLWLHLGASGLAMALGLISLLKPILPTPNWLHRWLGRIYAACVCLGILGGALILPTARQGGHWGQVALGGGLLLWTYFTLQMVGTARRQKFHQHRGWAYRSYAITFSGVTLRILLDWGIGLGWQHQTAYIVAAFGCFAVNLILAEWIWVRQKARSAESSTLEG